MNFKNRNTALVGKYSANADIMFKNNHNDGSLLLLEQPKENTNILKSIGFDQHLNEIEKEAHLINSKVQLKQMFGVETILGSEIKKLCNDYDLVISRVSNYKGAPHSDLPTIIQAFIDKNSEVDVIPSRPRKIKVYLEDDDEGDLSMTKLFDDEIQQFYQYQVKQDDNTETVKKSRIKTSYSNWFILAPREAFHGYKKNTCCTLFYRDNDDSRSINEEDVFCEVYSWGNNYSEMRKNNHFLKYINYTKESAFRNGIIKEEGGIFPLFYILLLLSLLNIFLYSSSFSLAVIVQSLLLLAITRIMNKKNKDYLELWKI